MNRKTTSRRHLARALLALGLAAIVNLSCGKDDSLLKPSSFVSGSRDIAAATGGVQPWLEFVSTEAIVTFPPGGSPDDFVAVNPVEVVSTLSLPPSDDGLAPEETYYLIRSTENRSLDLLELTHGPGTPTVSRHNRVWMPEDDRGGLSFDDHDTWRLGGEYLSQPAIATVRIPQARLLTEGLKENIAILDTGVDVLHPLFTSNYTRFRLFQNYTVWPPTADVSESGNGVDEDQDGVADDGVGHGTHVTGIAFTGARKATFFIFKVLDDEGRGTSFGLAKAVKAAADNGAHIINLSLGLNVDDPMLRHVFKYCKDRGIAVVASAGNRGEDFPQYPAAYDEVVSVTAVDNQDVKAEFASFGQTVDIAAPGVDIIGPIPGCFGPGKYAVASGSSMATPFVSAAIALVQAKFALAHAQDAIPSVARGAVDITAQNPTTQALMGTGRVDFVRPLTMPFIVVY